MTSLFREWAADRKKLRDANLHHKGYLYAWARLRHGILPDTLLAEIDLRPTAFDAGMREAINLWESIK